MVDESKIHREETDDSDPNAITHHNGDSSGEWLDSNVAPRSDEWVGRTIGQFEIVRIIGTGGMGNVYEAKQLHPHRSVALKIVKTAAATPAALHRFEMESEMLARLQHPGIAQVYDSGHQIHDDVLLPFFAMEYVPGSRSITDYSEDEHLSLLGRLGLFLGVCEAVQYGHGRGVIHRDLKPSNILITTSGRPKVIDFGVALMADSDETETTLTVAGRFVGTLQWSSPEQSGDDPHDVDVRTDVYSLGMVLYQLVTGKLAYSLKGIPIYQAASVVRETHPTPPREIDSTIPIELEQILAKSLSKVRELRYESVAEMAMDIKRFLNDQPIHAKTPSIMRRLHLYARRNQLRFRAAIVVFLALVLGLTGLIWGFLDAQASRKELVTALHDEEQARFDAEQKAYIATIGTVQAAIANQSWDMARQRLSETTRNQRGWEWHYLQGIVDNSLRMQMIGDRPTSLATAPNGSYFVVSFEGDRVVLFDEKNDVIRNLSLPSQVRSLESTLDGSFIYLGMSDGQIAMLDMVKDTMLIVDTSTKSIESIASMHEGSFATGHADGVVRIWSSIGELLRELEVSSNMILSLDFHDKTNRLAIGAVDGTVKILDVESDTQSIEFGRHDGSARVVMFLDENRLISGGEDDKIVVWDIESKQPMVELQSNHGSVMDIAINGDILSSVGTDGTVRLWTTNTFELIDSLRGHDNLIWSIGTLGDRGFVSVGQDGSIRWWSASEPQPTSYVIESRLPATDIAFVWNDILVSVSDPDHNLQVIDLSTGLSDVLVSDSDRELSTLEFVPTTSFVVTGDVDGEVLLWDIEEKKMEKHIGTCDGQVSSMDVSPFGKKVAVGSFSGQLCVWNISDEAVLIDIHSSDCIVLSIVFNSNGEKLFVSTSDGIVRAIDLASGEATWTMIGNGLDIVDMAYVPTIDAVLTSTASNTIQLLDAKNGSVLKTVEIGGAAIRDIGVFPDGKRFATAHENGNVGIWRVDTLSRVASFPASQSTECIDVSSDGYRLAIGGSRGTIILMDAMARGARRNNSANERNNEPIAN